MKKYLKLLALIISSIFFGCSSTDDCTKTIVIPSRTIVTPSGSSFIPETSEIVPCDYEIPPIQEQLPVENFSYEVVNFEFIQNTGNNTNRLKFEIKLNNLNNFVINGFAYITLDVDGTVSSSGFLNGASSICGQINPNSSCIFSYDKESSLELGLIQSIQLVNVKYYLAN
ncbi:hypothetical protein [Flavobacterium lacus]|uniref:Lipoprotein n=1 Tax=Flavobacterium lacus TaxID=1353778 RepID=A0A328WYP7_9FLAO|nr:hypothetical protein [Flavobacterium lacus]RAR50226.1 hypothetical protein B0I10_10220 [Flavobacterium lacus]